MTWPAYPTYRESGVPGLGQVPTEWSTVRMDKYLEYVKHPVSPEVLAGIEVFHYSIPVVQATGSGAIEEGAAVDSNKFRIDRALILVSKLNPRKATVCLAVPQSRLTVCSTEFVPLAPRDVDLGFVKYVVTSDLYRQRLESLVESATRSHQRVNPSDVYRFWWAMPSVRDQREIAAFLDRETARIDELIDKQNHLIATLREDRTATITHAVTKGLDPGVDIKDSGVEWLGNVPVHWVVRPVVSGCRLVQTGPFGSQLHASDYIDDGTPIINPSHIIDGKITPSPNHAVRAEKAAELARHRLVCGDVITARRGELGRCAVVETDAQGFLCGTGSLLIRLKESEFSPRYFCYLFGSSANRERLTQISAGSTMDNLNAQMVARLKVCRPPLLEQDRIVSFLDHRCARIDALIEKARGVIEILQEYRSALITDAVTGKIDVRKAA